MPQYRGFSRTRSRASTKVRALRSHRASANIPTACLHPPRLDGREQRFRVRMPALGGRSALRVELLAQHQVVVHLAVEGDDEAAAGRHHRLMPSGREVQNRQPTVPQRQAGNWLHPHP